MGQGFKPGEGGRPLGCKNKFKLTKVRKYFEDQGMDPIKEMMELYSRIHDTRDKLAFWIKLLPWIEPRINLVEHIGERTSELPTELEQKLDGVLFEILQPGKLNGTNGPSA